MNASHILIGVVLILVVYQLYIQPKLKSVKDVYKDEQLQIYLNIIEICKDVNIHSYEKFYSQLRAFFGQYLNSFNFYNDESTFNKMKNHKHKCMKYVNRIPLDIHNDMKLSNKLQNAIYNIDMILETYLNKVAYEKDIFYHKSNDIDSTSTLPSNI